MLKLITSLFQPPKEGQVFLNYRRSDSLGFTGRLADSLSAIFGESRVFRDVEDIKGGARFDEVIQKALTHSPCLLVMIGPDWVDTSDAAGNNRLFVENDWVAAEIAYCLKADIPVIPVLLQGTPMPRPSELPPAIQPLCQRNAVYLSDQSWEDDLRKISDIIAEKIPGTRSSAVLHRAKVLTPLLMAFGLLVSAMFMILNWDEQPEKFKTAMISPLWIGIGLSSMYLTHVAGFAEKKSRKLLQMTAIAGVSGGLVTAAIFALSQDDIEAQRAFWAGLCTLIIMFIMMIFSGFRAKY